jgi:F-type H+-transporting ATPase subunit gamma
MKLVSVNKLRRAQEAEKRVADYAGRIHAMVGHLTAGLDAVQEHPLLKPRAEARNVHIVVIASDRGLCGGFNTNLLREVAKWIAIKQKTATVRVSCCGRKANNFLKTRFPIERYYDQAIAHPDFNVARQIGHELLSGFLSGRLDEVHVAWNKTNATAGATPCISRFIPIDAALVPVGKVPASHSWLVEPDTQTLLQSALPNLVTLRLYQALLASAAGEHGARMRAMDQATTNADQLIRAMTLERNRVRQAQITKELSEIVAGAEALQ